MSLLVKLGAFLGALLKAVLPTIFRELRKPKEAKMAGGDEGLAADIDADITAELLNQKAGLTWVGRAKCSGCGNHWVATVPVSENERSMPVKPLECPKCRKMTGLADPDAL